MINKVQLIGNVGGDVESRTLENDTMVAAFSLATSESWKDKNGEWVNSTEWHKIQVWRHTAKYAVNNIKKGMQLYVEGKIKTRKWQDKEGNDRYTTEIVANTIRLLGRRDEENTQNASSAASAPQQNYEPASDGSDSLPF